MALYKKDLGMLFRDVETKVESVLAPALACGYFTLSKYVMELNSLSNLFHFQCSVWSVKGIPLILKEKITT